MENKVILIDYMGSDKLHGLAAWASTFADLDIPIPDDINLRVDELVNHILNNGKKKRTIKELLSYLAENEHSSPFRFSSFVFAMTTEISSHIQKLKHSVILEAENGESARYKEMQEDKFYLPKDWNGIEVKTLNEYDENYFKYYETWKQVLEGYTEMGNRLYHNCLKDLTPVLGKQRAKESARFFKTYNSQINTFNKFSFDGVLQFYKKRGSQHAQLEIRDIANQMLECIKNIPENPFEYTLKAFGYDM